MATWIHSDGSEHELTMDSCGDDAACHSDPPTCGHGEWRQATPDEESRYHNGYGDASNMRETEHGLEVWISEQRCHPMHGHSAYPDACLTCGGCLRCLHG